MATYTGIKKIKIGDNVFEFGLPTTAADVGINFEYTTSGNNRAVLQDSSGNLYVIQKDNNDDTKVTTTVPTDATSIYLAGSTSSSTNTAGLTKFVSGVLYGTATNSTSGYIELRLGNGNASNTAGGKEGTIRLYGTGQTYYTTLKVGAPTANRTITFPNATGTVALTSNIPDVSGKIDTAGTGLSKSSTTLNHSNSVTAQTTQAIYPIKIDAQGHISAYGTAVTPLTSSSTLDATKLSGTIPTSCYSDVSVITTTVDTATTYYLTGSTKATTYNGGLSKHGSIYANVSADADTNGVARLYLGNATATSSAGGKQGILQLYGTTTKYIQLFAGAPSANRSITLPDKEGTVALTSDIKTYTFANGTNGFTVTPSGGTAQTVTVTPSLTAADVGAVPTSRTVNGQSLTDNIADADYITEQGTKTASSYTWYYRKFNSGKVETWALIGWTSAASTAWSSPIRYMDKTITMPSGIFSTTPTAMYAVAGSNQYWVIGVTPSSATAASIRLGTVATSNMATQAYIYAFGS